VSAFVGSGRLAEAFCGDVRPFAELTSHRWRLHDDMASSLFRQSRMQPGSRHLPIAADCACVDAEHGGHLVIAQTGKVPELNYLALPWIDGLKRLQCLVDYQDIFSVLLGKGQVGREFGSVSTIPPGRIQRPCVVHENPAHYFGGYGKEMFPVLPLNLRVSRQAEEGLVHQRGCLQSVIAALTSHCSPGKPSKLLINDRI